MKFKQIFLLMILGCIVSIGCRLKKSKDSANRAEGGHTIALAVQGSSLGLTDTVDQINADVICGTDVTPVNQNGESDNSVTLYGDISGCKMRLNSFRLNATNVYTGSLESGTAIFTSGPNSLEISSGSNTLAITQGTSTVISYFYKELGGSATALARNIQITSGTVEVSGKLAPKYIVESVSEIKISATEVGLEIKVSCGMDCVSDIRYETGIDSGIPIGGEVLNALGDYSEDTQILTAQGFTIQVSISDLGLKNYEQFSAAQFLFAMKEPGFNSFSYAQLRKDPLNGSWNPTEVIVSRSDDAYEHDVTSDNNGNFIGVWKQSDGTGIRVWASKHNGTSWEGPQIIDAEQTASKRFPKISAHPTGTAIAVWQELHEGKYRLISSHYDGSQWNTPLRLDNDDSNSAEKHQVSTDNFGGGIVVWQQGNKIQARVFDKGIWGSDVLTLDSSAANGNPIVKSGPKGGAIVGWSDSGNIKSRILNPDGRWVETRSISSTNTGFDVAYDPSGRHIAVVSEYDASIQKSVIQTFRYSGDNWGPKQAASNPSYSASYPKVTFDALGNATLVWIHLDSVWKVATSRFSEATTTWSTPTVIDQNPSSLILSDLVLSMNYDGFAAIAWKTRNSNYYTNVKAAIFNKDQWLVSDTTSGSNYASNPEITINPKGEITVIWNAIKIYARTYK